MRASWAGAIVVIATVSSAAETSPPAVDHLSILAPAPAGNGWDQTARAMQHALLAKGLARTVEVANSPGAGGAIGLAEFANAQRGDGRALLVGGLVMLNAIRDNHYRVSLAQTTPIARLTGELEVIVVAADSPLRDLAALVRAMKADPSSVSFAGAAGGPDDLFLQRFSRAIGVDATRTTWVSVTGGSEVADAVVGKQVTAGLSGFGELSSRIESGELRTLAISAEEPTRDGRLRTLREQGINLSFVNWRGVFAPPGISDGEKETLRTAIQAMTATREWRQALEHYRWRDLYLSGNDFVRFLVEEEARSELPAPHRPGAIVRGGTWSRRAQAGLASIILLFACIATFVTWQRLEGVRRERELWRQLEHVQEQYRQRSAETQDLLEGLSAQIGRQFEKWALTNAEREVAMLMLKGLRHKEIATIRGTSERTVRTQALTVYKKAGLDGRTDLAAFFLEDFLLAAHPVQPSARRAG